MVVAMNEIERQAAFYRGYLADDRNLASVAAVLVIGVAFWLLVYLVSLVGAATERGFAQPAAIPDYAVSKTHAR